MPPSRFPAQGRGLLPRIRAVLPHPPVTRFAPAPTGWLHLGHLVNAIWVWGIARALGGRVVLRVEDHDRSRCRAKFEAGLLEDLDWLGLVPDLLAPRQSERGDAYRAGLDRLGGLDLAYGCRCSRREIAALAGDLPGVETPYPGSCRALGLPPGAGDGARIRLEPGAERFDDLRLGPQAQDPALQCGDLLARDRAGQWTYQYCVVVDDRDQGVDLVVRGEDLLSSTGRQLRLARLLGRPAPALHLHHPLLHRPDGGKLSKANHDTGLRDLRAAGHAPEALLGEAAARSGLLDRPRSLRVADLPSLFAG